MIEGQPYIDEVITREGGELLFKGRELWTLCNLHGERTPSFKISTNRVHGHCFGCGWHGDSLDYVRALHGLTFKDALTYLGIEKKQAPADIRAATQARREREEDERNFREWERNKVNSMSAILRLYRQKAVQGFTPEDLEVFAPLIHAMPQIEHEYETVFCVRDDSARRRMFEEERRGNAA